MMKLAAFYITILVHVSVTWAFASNNLRGATTTLHKRLDTKLYGEISDEMRENFRKLGFRKPKPIRRSAVSNQDSLDSQANARRTFQASIKNAYHKSIFQVNMKNAYNRQMKIPTKPIIRRTAVGPPRNEESIRDSIMNLFRRPCDIDINDAAINITTEYYDLEFLIEKTES